MTTDILLVDDHAIFRKGLRLLVEEEDELRVVGEAGDGQAAIELARELAPDVVVMDITMPGMDGIEATRHIVTEFPNTKVMVLSIHGDKRFVEDMLQAGAAGYVLKESAPEELVVGIRTVARGEVYLSPAITGIVVSQYVGLLAGGSDADDESTRQPVAAPSVLRTKLHRPQISSRAVNRTRLLEQLVEGSQAQLALITAAAGYGKSTLVSQWIEQSDLPNCWISLDQEDADLRTFLLYVTSAIQTIFRDAVPNTSTLLLAPNLPPPSEVARTLLNELDQAPERFILALDDFHRIHSESVSAFLDELLRHPSPSLLLVIVTRTDPNLGLADLRASGRMLEIRSHDLRFSDDETLALLQKTRGKSIDEALAAQLNRRMEGWATGLHLATLSMDESLEFESTIEDAPGEHLTLDYMLTEVLSRQPEAMQVNLMKTAILDRFSAPLCEAVCGPPIEDGTQGQRGEEFIDWLVRRNLFVIALDNRRQWFRFHHLFQELLQERLQNALSSEEIGDLHAKACRWFEEAGLIDEAIGYALNGGYVLGAADIVERRWRFEVNNDRWYVVKRWLTLLPEGSVNQRPGLLLAQAWTEYFQSQMVRIGSIIEKVESLTDEQTVQPEISQDLDFFRGCLEYWSGNGETSLQLLEGTLTELPARPRIIEGNYAIYFGLAHHMCGHADLAVQALTDLLQAVDPVAERFASQILGGLVFVHLLSGALHSAAAQARRLQLLAQKVGMHNTDAWVSYFHGYVAIQTLQLEQAQYHFTMAVDKRYVFEPEAAIDSFVGLALIQQLKGQPDDAQETLDRLLEFAEIIHQPNLLTIVDSCIARLALLRGDLPTAFRWARSFNEPPESAGLFMWLEAPVITQARVLIAFGTENSLLQASELLAAIRHASEANYYTCQVIEVAILQAMVLEKQGRLPEALESLEQALALSEPGGFIRPFTELGQPMSALLVRLRSAVVGDNLATYIDRILASFPAQDTTSAACDQSPLIEPLTDRELQVLRLLATELSIDEIASYLVVSPGTVRTHTRSIYSKLDVHRRSAAVFRGQELDLI